MMKTHPLRFFYETERCQLARPSAYLFTDWQTEREKGRARAGQKKVAALKAISHYVFYKYIGKLALNALLVRLSIQCEIVT